MQNSHRQLRLKDYWSLFVIVVFAPILLWAANAILPTFDDWTATTTPDFSPFFTKERFLFYGYHWRPFDAITGYIVGRNPQVLYPAFNHSCVVLGHVVCAFLVFVTCRSLGFSKASANVATLFFFITPATMATVLAVDSLNQTYALLWGMISFLLYTKLRKGKYVAWLAAVAVATLWKENGLMWALIGPILAFSFNITKKQVFRKDLLIGLSFMAVYALAIMVLPKDIVIHPEYVPDVSKVIGNFVKFLFTSFVTIDYVWLLHEPSRQWLLAIITLLPTLPFLYLIFIKNYKSLLQLQPVGILCCLFVTVAPHIGTVFSMMHTYAGLSLIALLIAYIINRCYSHSPLSIKAAFLLFIISAFVIDIHLWYESKESGLVGKRMAQEAIRKTGTPVKSVYVITVEDDYPKLSSFCVIPNEAFGWGLAAQYETNYQWPEIIQDTTLLRTSNSISVARELAKEKLARKAFDCAWIVNHKNIEVIRAE